LSVMAAPSNAMYAVTPLIVANSMPAWKFAPYRSSGELAILVGSPRLKSLV